MDIDQLRALGLFNARVPRYTSYPPATVFSTQTDRAFQTQCLAELDPADPISVYVHIPFCERLCWFCACRTQGTTSLNPVVSYLQSVTAELALLRDALPAGIRMGHLHWGGGTPTILPPELIHSLAQDIMAVIPQAEEFDFSVEIDPTMVDAPKIQALADVGMTRASIGIQDFAEDVQDAIGRHQSFEQTRACVDMLRAAGVTSLNADLVYGLPHQTNAKIAASVDKVLQLNPDRIALFGYAHVPHMSKRQKLIDETALPTDEARHALSELATQKFVAAGYDAIGIDHFTKPDDSMAKAARAGNLRRNFQGYTEDSCQTLVGIGASSISRFKEGYVQNAAATPAYLERIAADQLAVYRGHINTPDDMLRARVIEMVVCDFAIDLTALDRDFGAAVHSLLADHDRVCARFGTVIKRSVDRIEIVTHARLLARLVANIYDASEVDTAVYSKAS